MSRSVSAVVSLNATEAGDAVPIARDAAEVEATRKAERARRVDFMLMVWIGWIGCGWLVGFMCIVCVFVYE